jgi:hypothetical protein
MQKEVTNEAIYLVLDDLIVTNPVSVRRQSIQSVVDCDHSDEGSNLKQKTPAGVDRGHAARGNTVVSMLLVSVSLYPSSI